MLSWLKRRARNTINSRYASLFRRPTNMFVSEQSLFSQQNLKLVVLNYEGRDFSVEVTEELNIKGVKQMAIGHFFSPNEAVGEVLDDVSLGVSCSKNSRTSKKYRLVLVREARQLDDDSSINIEQLKNNDELLLVECREPIAAAGRHEDAEGPSLGQIKAATEHLEPKHHNRDADPANPSLDFQTEFRRILVTMIEVSVRLINADPDAEEVFTQIQDKLERRHRPRVDRAALRQLMEMGFTESRATKALQVKRTVTEAMEWLLEHESLDEGLSDADTAAGAMIDNTTVQVKASEEGCQNKGPDEKFLHNFRQYRRKWFQPNQRFLQKLMQMGFNEEKVTEALRATGNNESRAVDILTGEQKSPPDDMDMGLERDSPIISAILASPVIQLALPKPKTLLALMMLFESPNNANMWLSDPDTHPVVSQVLRIYHAEKHSLNNGPSSLSDPLNPSAVSNAILQTVSRSGHLDFRVDTSSSSNPTFPLMRGESSSIIASSIASHHSFPTSNYPHVEATAFQRPRIPSGESSSSSPIPTLIARNNSEEPMSHSGSPVRELLTEPSNFDLISESHLGLINESLPDVTTLRSSSMSQAALFSGTLNPDVSFDIVSLPTNNTDIEMDEQDSINMDVH